MNTTIKAIVLLLSIIQLSCSKKNSDDPTPPIDNDTFKQEAVTQLSFFNILNGNPTQVQFHYRTTRLNIFNKNASGTYRIEFHGKSGRPMLEGNPRNPNITNLAVWPIPVGDTFRVFKNGVKYRDYVTEVEDNINDGIVYYVLVGQTIDQVRSGGNSFTASGGTMSALSFKPIE